LAELSKSSSSLSLDVWGCKYPTPYAPSYYFCPL